MININRATLSSANLETVELDYEPKEIVYERGASAEFVYVVNRGALCRLQVFSQARCSVSEFLLQGDGFGFEIEQCHRDMVQTLSATTLLAVRREAVLNAITKDCEFAKMLFNLAARDVILAEQQATRLRSTIATERVAQFLIEMDDRLSVGRKIELPMRRKHIADYLGITFETVSRVLNRLQKDGVIECLDVQRRKIVIRDKVRLQKLTADGSGMVYSEQTRHKKRQSSRMFAL